MNKHTLHVMGRRRVRDNGQTGYHYDQALFNFDLKAGA
jgi:hypothetical protein